MFRNILWGVKNNWSWICTKYLLVEAVRHMWLKKGNWKKGNVILWQTKIFIMDLLVCIPCCWILKYKGLSPFFQFLFPFFQSARSIEKSPFFQCSEQIEKRELKKGKQQSELCWCKNRNITEAKQKQQHTNNTVPN